MTSLPSYFLPGRERDGRSSKPSYGASNHQSAGLVSPFFASDGNLQLLRVPFLR